MKGKAELPLGGFERENKLDYTRLIHGALTRKTT